MSGQQKRLVFTDGIKNKFAFEGYADGVYAIIGPFENFTHDQEFQNDLETLCRKFNLKHGHLSKAKFDQLERGRSNWQPIDTAPKNKRVLVRTLIENHRLVIGFQQKEGIWLDELMQPMHFAPLEWQPLPT